MAPKPDYEREGIRLYLADCRDVLPHLSGVDAVVTDPPYGCKWNGSQSKKPLLYRGTRETPRWQGSIIGDDVAFDPGPFLAFPAAAFTGVQYFYVRHRGQANRGRAKPRPAIRRAATETSGVV